MGYVCKCIGGIVLENVEKTYSVSEVASQFDLSDGTIRKYEKDYSINIPRNELGHRYYTDREIEVFKQIIKLKEQGANIHVINNLLTRSVDFQEQQEQSLDLITMDKMTGLEVKQLLDNYLSDSMIARENQSIKKYDKIEQELEEVKNQNKNILEQNEKLIELIQQQNQKKNEKKSFWSMFKK